MQCGGEEKARDWIAGNSDEKFLITDEWTVAGYEFDTVILVAYDHQMRGISSVCQRARAKLIVYQIDKLASEDLRALKVTEDISTSLPRRRRKKPCSIQQCTKVLFYKSGYIYKYLECSYRQIIWINVYLDNKIYQKEYFWPKVHRFYTFDGNGS